MSLRLFRAPSVSVGCKIRTILIKVGHESVEDRPQDSGSVIYERTREYNCLVMLRNRLRLSRMWLCTATAIWATTLIGSSVQGPDSSPDKYIEQIFRSEIGEVPRLGWFVPFIGPNAHFVAAEKHAALVLYSTFGTPSTASGYKPVSSDEHQKMKRDFSEACEIEQSNVLAAYDIAAESVPAERALYTVNKLPGETRSGLITIRLSATEIATVNRLLGWPERDISLRRDEAIAVRPNSSFYSFHRLYDSTSGELKQEAFVLHDKNHGVLAHDLQTLNGPPCDGCGIPRYVDGTGDYILNLFEFPGFTYPVLLLNTSTVEGRALSLMTFTPDRKLATFRLYEYVVHCG